MPADHERLATRGGQGFAWTIPSGQGCPRTQRRDSWAVAGSVHLEGMPQEAGADASHAAAMARITAATSIASMQG
jgi:hypothetical protein